MIQKHSTRLSQVHDEEPGDEQEQHRTAAHDYPEMGSILADRPDPGGVITVIGARRTAAAYGTPEDARNTDYNGGEGDLGMNWAEPANQGWVHENLGPQQEAPPPLYDPDMNPVMGRLAAIEEAAALIGTRHHATDINGTHVDDAGDAPRHGTVPRASSPDSYDAASHEGEGDDRWNEPLPPEQHGNKKAENAATVGMYPEGMSAGGGPGLEIGAFTASRVPWTGEERGRLHRWQEEPTATWGDFVPSPEFLGRDAPVKSEVEERQQEADGLGPATASSESAWEEHLRGHHGWGDIQFSQIRAHGDRPQDLHQGLHDAGMANHSHAEPGSEPEDPGRERSLRNMFGPDITEGGPRMSTPAGYPLAAPEHGGAASGDPARALDRLRRVRPAPDPAVYQQTDPARFRRMMSALNVHVHVNHGDDDDAGVPAHEHDDADDTLDSPVDKNSPDNDSSQVSGTGQADSPVDAPVDGIPPDPADSPPADPGQWPAAGADVSERSRAWTQGRDDGKVTRGAPAPAPFSPDDGDSGGGGDQDADDKSSGSDPNDSGGDNDTPFSKDGALAMFTAAAGNRDFRFEFTATWHDVVAKAKRIRAEGHVRVTHASLGMVIGEVRGDHDTYESGIQRPVGKRHSIQHWACGCPWASFHQDKAQSGRYAGRPCSHVMALQFEAQARGMFGRSVEQDGALPSWAPETVVVKSWPPYEGDPHAGRWSEQWRAPVERQRMSRRATPDEARDWNWTPEERDAWEASHGAPCQRATAALARHGEDPEEIGALRLLAGVPESGLRIACMGNSIAANGNSLEGGDTGLSFLRWASLLSGGRIRHAGSFSAGGASSSQILASQLVPVVAARPDACVIGPWAVNNPVLGVSFERTAADTENAVLALRVAGIAPLISLEPPAADPERSAFVRRYNAWAQRFAARSGVPVADFFTALSDRNGAWAGGYSADGIHPTAAGARVMGQAVAGLLNTPAAMRVTADSANGPWGSNNTVQHPPQKPYGATSPPNVDQDPGSYGPLAAPDPENWGSIDSGSAMQMPLTNTAAHQVLVPGAPRPVPGDLHWPGTEGWAPEDQGTFSFSDRAPAAGPSTGMTPRDPNGIRMEESRATDTGALAQLHDEPEPALPSTTGDDEIEATAAADGTIGGGDAGTGQGQGAALDTAALGEFGASVRAAFRQMFGGTPMGDLNRETSPQGQYPSPVTQEPGMGSQDEYLSPDNQSIQTIGNQQWSGGGADSDEVDVSAGVPQGGIEDIVASFQRSAAAKDYGGGGPARGDGDIAAAAREFLSKTADVLPAAEADALVSEGRGQRARNLNLLRLEGTHYEDEEDELAKKGLSLDSYDDDVIFA